MINCWIEEFFFLMNNFWSFALHLSIGQGIPFISHVMVSNCKDIYFIVVIVT